MPNHNQTGERNIAPPSENRPSWSPQENDDDHDYLSWRVRNNRDNDRAATELDPRRWEGGRGSELGYISYGPRGAGEGRHGEASIRNERMASHGDPGHRAEPLIYRSGSSGRGYTYGAQQQHHHGEARSLRHPTSSTHVHRGTGPHRGKGPLSYRRTDERIRELVCEALTDDDQLDASRIEVSVHDGDVTLSGAVDDRQAKRDAEDCAWSVAGVRDVQNLLRTNARQASPRDEKYRE